MTMTIGSMCSGVGGLDRAVERIFNAEPAWFCEYDDAPARILSARWPDVRNFRDITLCDWATMTRVGIVCAGYPCQPFSAAGKRKGTADERHLWPYCLDAINTLRPRWSFFENVAGHLTLGFDTVTSDLAVHGWYVRWFVCRASDIGATHHRKRVFIGVSREPWPVPAGARVIARIDDSGQWVEPDDGLFGGIPFEGRWPRAGAVVDGVAYEVDVDVARAAALEVLPTPNAHNSNDGEGFETWDARRRAQKEKHQNGNGRGMPLAIAVQTLPTPTASDADKSRDNPAQAKRHSPPLSAVTAHFPTPRSSRGGSTTETMYALGGVRDNTNRPQGEVLLPTPRAMEANQTMGAPAALQHVADGNGGLTEVLGVHLLPTPQASDGVGGKVSAQVGGTRPSGAKRSIDLPTVAARELKGWGELLREPGRMCPTCETGLREGWGSWACPDPNNCGDDRWPADEPIPAVLVQQFDEDGDPMPLLFLPTPTTSEATGAGTRGGGTDLRTTLAANFPVLPTPNASDASGGGLHPGRAGHTMQLPDYALLAADPARWGKYTPAINRWARVIGRPAPDPTEPNRNGGPRLAARFAEWMMGWPEGWVTGETETAWRARLAYRHAGHDVRPVGHRGTIRRWISPLTRAEQLKAIGNGVVDLQAEYAIRTIMSWPERAEAAAA